MNHTVAANMSIVETNFEKIWKLFWGNQILEDCQYATLNGSIIDIEVVDNAFLASFRDSVVTFPMDECDINEDLLSTGQKNTINALATVLFGPNSKRRAILGRVNRLIYMAEANILSSNFRKFPARLCQGSAATTYCVGATGFNDTILINLDTKKLISLVDPKQNNGLYYRELEIDSLDDMTLKFISEELFEEQKLVD